MNPRRALCCHSQVTLNISNPFEGNEAFLQHTAPAPQSLHSAQDSSKPDLKPTEIARTLPATHNSTGSPGNTGSVCQTCHTALNTAGKHTPTKPSGAPRGGGFGQGWGVRRIVLPASARAGCTPQPLQPQLCSEQALQKPPRLGPWSGGDGAHAPAATGSWAALNEPWVLQGGFLRTAPARLTPRGRAELTLLPLVSLPGAAQGRADALQSHRTISRNTQGYFWKAEAELVDPQPLRQAAPLPGYPQSQPSNKLCCKTT